MVNKMMTLSNGSKMPVVGLGTYKSGLNEADRVIKDAIDAGYRHFDCAWFYANEAEIGRAFKEKINDGTVKREDLFITTKLWNNFHEKDKVVPTLKESLAMLQLDYVDLYLIHWPFAFKESASIWPINEGKEAFSETDYLQTWAGMEECVKLGLAKNIGVSNFNKNQLTRVLENCEIPPAVNQVECNPNLNQKRLIEFCRSKDITVVGYCPLGRSENSGQAGFPDPTIYDPKVIEMSKKYKKSPAQVVLNYLVSLGISVIPKTVTKSRMVENMDIFDFQLHDEDVEYLDSCNKNVRVCPFTTFSDHPLFPFHEDY